MKEAQSSRNIHVLGIETSCDDTGVAIIRHDGHVLSNCIHSQLKHHLALGGIIPMVAKELHVNNIDAVARRAFDESRLHSVADDINAIAVTNRPGLDYSLRVGLNYAKHLAKKYSKPLIPIHHMQAHALMPLLENRAIRFPFLAVLLSGGHCLLSLCERYNKFHLLGASYNDSPGEMLDKLARRLRLRNLGPPFDRISGGAAIELLSRRPSADRFKYFNEQRSIPMCSKRSCDMSFSGYWGNINIVLPKIDDLWIAGDKEVLLEELGHLCGSLQRAILVQVFRKLQRAMIYYRTSWRHQNAQAFELTDEDRRLNFQVREQNDDGLLDVVVSGGVAANTYLTESIENACKSEIDSDVRVYRPSKELCSDNGLMIAWNGMLRYISQGPFNEHNVDLNESVIYDTSQVDRVETIASSPIGSNISSCVELLGSKLPKLMSRELKFVV